MNISETTRWQNEQDERRERMLRELASDLAEQVRTGAITDMQANDWYNMKADQWVNGV